MFSVGTCSDADKLVDEQNSHCSATRCHGASPANREFGGQVRHNGAKARAEHRGKDRPVDFPGTFRQLRRRCQSFRRYLSHYLCSRNSFWG